MLADFELAASEMAKLVSWAREDNAELTRNEADTRLHLVDQLFFNCLGWNREDCHSEERFEGRYTDYSFGSPRRLVIEAKREGIHFDLPAGFNKRVCRIKTIVDGNADVEAAIRQVLAYCQERGIPLGAVCNGWQLIAFIGSRPDGVPPIEGQCLVFRSLEDMASEFRTLWDNLSKSGVFAYTLYGTLRTEGIHPPPEKISHRISDYPGVKNRNPFQVQLKILGELFIEDVVRAPQLEDEFLKDCYCPSGALSQYALISKEILQARYAALFDKELGGVASEPVHTKRGLSEEFTDDILAASLKRRAIILLGDVGVGKTIFIRNLIKVAAREVFEKALALHIDFGKEPALAEDLESFVLRRCSSQLLDDHGIDIEENGFVRGVYHGELLRFSRGIYAGLAGKNPDAYLNREIEFLREKLQDKAAHLRACLTHIFKAHRRQIVIFLDNIDQRPFDFQERVFLIGQSFAETWPATVFISLRPETFYHSRTRGSLAAYQPRVFTIAPPRVDQVIKLRLEFVLKQAQSTGTFGSLSPGLSVKSGSLNGYIEVLLRSFASSKGLVEFIDNLSGGNTRQALDFVTAFIGSGHVNAEKILSIAEEFGSYTIPVHEFMRAVIYGDFEHFDPAASPIVNLFDISMPDGREHFLLGNVLSFVQRLGDIGESNGFVEAAKVYEFCQNIGFIPSQIEFALQRARAKKLLDVLPRFADVSPSSYRITTAGAYSFKELPTHFSYVDAVIVDTPIVDPKIRPLIADTQGIAQRLARMRVFQKYLDTQYASFDANQATFDWPALSASLESEVAKIQEAETRRENSRKLKA
jgi:hypothetical protein